MNVVMTGAGELVEVQATGEGVAVLAGRARRAARPGGGGHRLAARQPRRRPPARRRPEPRAARGRPRLELHDAIRARDPQRTQAAGARRAARAARARAAARSASSCRRRRRHLRGERARSRRAPPPRATGRPALADDSGIAVDGARRRARDPLRPLRRRAARRTSRTSRSCSSELRGRADRRAAYVCALALVEPDGARGAVRGTLRGHADRRAARQRRLRLRPGRSCPTSERRATSARWPSCAPEEKDEISHRGRAARALLEWLPVRA